jgi:hypothetical protein
MFTIKFCGPTDIPVRVEGAKKFECSAAKTIPIEFPELTPARNWFVTPSDNR